MIVLISYNATLVYFAELLATRKKVSLCAIVLYPQLSTCNPHPVMSARS